MATFQIVQADLGDVLAVTACARAAFAPYIPRIGREPAPMSADYARLIAAGHVEVAKDGAGAVLGFVCYYPEGDAMLLETVAVFPAVMGQGLGRALTLRCEQAARRSGLRFVRLYTNAAMTENLQLYPKLGYGVQGRRVEDGFDRVFFEKPLDQRPR